MNPALGALIFFVVQNTLEYSYFTGQNASLGFNIDKKMIW